MGRQGAQRARRPRRGDGLERIDGDDRLAAHALRRLGDVAAARGHQEKALALALSDVALRARVKSELAMTLLADGAFEDGLALLRESEAPLEQAHDDAGIAVARLRMAMAHRELGDGDAARLFARRALAYFEATDPALEGVAYAELAHVAIDSGELDEAEYMLDRASARAGAAFLTDAAITARRGMVAHVRGKLEEATTLFQHAVVGLRRGGYRRFEAGVLGYLAIAELELGEVERAWDWLRRAREMLRHEARAYEFFAGWLSVASLARGDVALAKAYASEIGTLRANDPLSVGAHLLTIPGHAGAREPHPERSHRADA